MEVVNRVCRICGELKVASRRGPATCIDCQPKERASYRRWYARHSAGAKEKKRLAMRRLRAANPERYAEHSRKAKRRVREGLLDLYGRICSLCGFSDERVLTLDHINNDGASERKVLSQATMYRNALNNYQPERYRTLCMNCQFIARIETGRQNQW